MNKYSMDIAVLDSAQNLLQISIHNHSKTVLDDWLLTANFARFIEPSSLSKGSVEQVGTYTKIKPAESQQIEIGGTYQLTFKIKSAPLTNYECGITEAYISCAEDNFIAQHALSVSKIKLAPPVKKVIDKICVDEAEVAVIPKVNRLKFDEGYFLVKAQLTYCANSEQALAATQWLAEELSYATQMTHCRCSEAGIEFIDNGCFAEGEYKLSISKYKILLTAASQTGFIHGAATLLQLLKKDQQQYSLRCVIIQDKPRFQYRGLMLDCARHFHSIATVKRLINQMAHFKLNHFHWHFTDDEGWRLEIKAFPQLTKTGAWRGPGTQLEPQFSHLSEKYGGFYSQAEIKEVIEYAAARGITVIPEIDIPGHCRAAIKSLPELLVDADDRSEYISVQGYRDNVLSPALAGTYAFLDAVIDEVCALFPAPYIHIGADEVPKGVWKKSPKCQALMAEHGYQDEVELQGHLLRHVEQRINASGKRMLGWEEAKFGDKVSKKTVIYSWISEEAAMECVEKGFDVVLQPSKFTYFDLVQDYSPMELGVDWAGTLPLQVAYQYSPLDKLSSTDPLRKHILGVQCALWSEVVLNQDRIDHMFFPRLLANAEVSWSAPEDKNWADFCTRLEGQKRYFKRNKINYRHF